MEQRSYVDAQGAARPERRSNLRLREIFDEAYELVAPFVDPAQRWGDHPLEHLAFRVLRERYPDLGSAEVQQLVLAAERVFRSRTAHHSVEPVGT